MYLRDNVQSDDNYGNNKKEKHEQNWLYLLTCRGHKEIEQDDHVDYTELSWIAVNIWPLTAFDQSESSF